MPEEIREISKGNFRGFRKLLNQKKGAYVLLFRPGGLSSFETVDAIFDLYQSPKLSHTSKRSVFGEHYLLESDLEKPNQRNYSIRKKSDWKGEEKIRALEEIDTDFARGFFENLELDPMHHFQISPQSSPSRTIDTEVNNRQALYIPKLILIGDAMTLALTQMVEEIKATHQQKGYPEVGIGEKQIQAVVDYVVGDLKTGKIMEHNFRAGQAADAVFSM